MARLFLWATLLLFSFYFSGHLFDIVANVPNWQSGEADDVLLYRDFYRHSSPARYFAPLVLGTPVASLVALMLVWKRSRQTRTLLGASFLIAAGVAVWTFLFFVPINEYIQAGEYEPVKLKELVTKWVMYDYLRLAITALGLASSIWALVSYEGWAQQIQKGSTRLPK
jgi:hypothetical protein